MKHLLLSASYTSSGMIDSCLALKSDEIIAQSTTLRFKGMS